MDRYTELLSALECPICTDYFSPPIRQCTTGHSICETCRKKLPKCGLCQAVFTESRNISLEALVVKMCYPCINRNSGCGLTLAYNEREIHEAECPFKNYKCALEKCPWMGRVEDITQHWASKNLPTKPYGESNMCYTKLKPISYFVNIVEAFDELFWFKCKITNKKWYWAVQYIGKASEAENYQFEIDIFKYDQPKRRILLSDYCQSIDLDDSVLFEEQSISIPTDVIQPFANKNQLLPYHMRIHVVKGIIEDVKTNNVSRRRPQHRSMGRDRSMVRNRSMGRDRSMGCCNKNKDKQVT